MGHLSIYSDFCFVTLVLSCILNGILAQIAHRRQDRIGFYRNFTFTFVIIDVSYSLAFATVQPICFSAPGVLVYFSIAPWNDHFELVQISMQIWLALFTAVIFCITGSFVYRYGLLCRPFLVSMFERPARCFITALFLTFCGSVWIYNYNYMIFHDSEDVRQRIQLLFGTDYDSDFENAYMLIVDLSVSEASSHSGAATAVAVAFQEFQLGIMVFCGWRIHRTVKTAAMSGNLKKMHGRALKMLIAQTLNPMLFFFAPCFIAIFGMFTNLDPLAHLLALFPIFNPIIVIYFTDDYKRYLLGQSTSTPQSENKTEMRELHLISHSRIFMPT